VRTRPDAALEGKDHRFGFATDESIEGAVENRGLELWPH